MLPCYLDSRITLDTLLAIAGVQRVGFAVEVGRKAKIAEDVLLQTSVCREKWVFNVEIYYSNL